MAKEKIISIKTGEAVKNIQDLKNNISKLKEDLAKLTIGEVEYKRTLKDLENNQAALRNAMHGTAASYGEVLNAAQAADIELTKSGKIAMGDTYSYNQLVRTLADLKEQWRSTTNAAERLKIGEKVNAVNDKLKELDKSVGVYGRNVGNYLGAVGQLTNAIGSMGKGASAAVMPIKNATSALSTLAANPVVAVLGLLANVLTKIIGELKSSEENTKALAAAMAPLKAIGDLFTKTLQQMGEALVKVVEWFGKLAGSIAGVNQETEKRIELTERELALTEQQRKTTMANADAEREISELRAKAADKATYSAKERISFLEQAGQKEREIAERAMQDAKAQYEIIKLRNSFTQSSTEELNEEADAYARMVQAQTAYNEKMRSINASLSAARKEAASEATAYANAVKAAAQKAAQEFAAMMESIDAEVQDEIDAIGEEILADIDEQEEAAANKTQRTLDAIAAGVERRMAWNAVLTEDEQEQEDKRYQIQMDGLNRQLEILEQARAAALDAGYLDSVLEYETQIADIKEEVALESARRSKEIQERDLKETERTAKQKQSVLLKSAGAISDILGSLADIYDANSENDKDAAEKAKNLRVASAIIDTISGAVAAYMGAQSAGLSPLISIPLGIASAATVTAAGMANVAKIKSTNISTSASGSASSTSVPATVQAPSLNPDISQVRTLTSASEEERLNQMASNQRVYILDSDIQASNASNRVRVAETTF